MTGLGTSRSAQKTILGLLDLIRCCQKSFLEEFWSGRELFQTPSWGPEDFVKTPQGDIWGRKYCFYAFLISLLPPVRDSNAQLLGRIELCPTSGYKLLRDESAVEEIDIFTTCSNMMGLQCSLFETFKERCRLTCDPTKNQTMMYPRYMLVPMLRHDRRQYVPSPWACGPCQPSPSTTARESSWLSTRATYKPICIVNMITVCKLQWSFRRCTISRRYILRSQPMKSTKARMLRRHIAAHLPLSLREVSSPGYQRTSAPRPHINASQNSDSISMHRCLRHVHCR